MTNTTTPNTKDATIQQTAQPTPNTSSTTTQTSTLPNSNSSNNNNNNKPHMQQEMDPIAMLLNGQSYGTSNPTVMTNLQQQQPPPGLVPTSPYGGGMNMNHPYAQPPYPMYAPPPPPSHHMHNPMPHPGMAPYPGMMPSPPQQQAQQGQQGQQQQYP